MFRNAAGLFLAVCTLSAAAAAGPLRGNCPDFSSAELAVQMACDQNADCSRIADQYGSCPKLRAWLGAVAPASGKTVTALDVNRALARARAPELIESESSVRASNCLGAAFALRDCRIFLGLGYLPPEDRVPDLDPALPSERAAVKALWSFAAPTMNDPRAAGRGEAFDALAACEGARSSPERAAICGRAQQAYERCRQAQDDWDARRTAVLLQLDVRRPDLGRSCRIPGREMDPANTGSALTNEWNCLVNVLRTFKLPGCPGFLPSSWQTPLQALAAWDQEDRAKGRGGASGLDTDGKGASTAPTAGAGTAASLFQQSAAQASRQANDPQAAVRAAADAKAREAEMSQLIAAGERRAQAIMGTMGGQITQAMQAAGSGRGPTGVSGVLGSTYSTMQQSAAPNGGTLASMPTLDQIRSGSTGTAVGAGLNASGASGSAEAGGVLSPSGPAPYDGDCKSGADQLAAEINAINARRPSNAQTIESLQTVMYIIQRGLNQYASAQCSGDPQAASQLTALRQQYSASKNACLQIAANASVCGPKLNW